MKICPGCGATWGDEYTVCDKCGTDLPAQPKEEKSFFARHKGRLLTYAILLCAFAVIVFAIFRLFLDRQDKTAVLYKTADAYYYLTADGKKTPFFDAEKPISDIRMSGDGKYVFFLADNTLYRKKAKSKATAEPIAEDAIDYAVSNDGKQLAVLCGDGTLSRLDKTEKTHLADRVTEFSISEDGAVVLYRTDDGMIRYRRGDNDPEPVAQDADKILYVSRDTTTVFFRSGKQILQKSGWDEPQVFLKDAEQNVCFFRDDSVYTVDENGTLSYRDINDTVPVPITVASVLWYGHEEPMLIAETKDGKIAVCHGTDCTVLAERIPADEILFCDGERVYFSGAGGFSCVDIKSGEHRTFAEKADCVTDACRMTVFSVDGALYRTENGEKPVFVSDGVTEQFPIADDTGYRSSAILFP